MILQKYVIEIGQFFRINYAFTSQSCYSLMLIVVHIQIYLTLTLISRVAANLSTKYDSLFLFEITSEFKYFGSSSFRLGSIYKEQKGV